MPRPRPRRRRRRARPPLSSACPPARVHPAYNPPTTETPNTCAPAATCPRSLDSAEFQRACAAFGWGLAASSIFGVLDPDVSGTVSYCELTAALSERHKAQPADAQRTIRALVASIEGGFAAQAQTATVCTKGWSIRGETASAVRDQIRALLVESGAPIVELIKKFDVECAPPPLHPRSTPSSQLRPRGRTAGPLLLPACQPRAHSSSMPRVVGIL